MCFMVLIFRKETRWIVCIDLYVCDCGRHLAEVEQHAEEGGVLHQLHGFSPRRSWTCSFRIRSHRVDLTKTSEGKK